MRIGSETPLVLASASPRRQELLALLDLAFLVLPQAIDESYFPGEAPGEYLERIVAAKLDAGVRGQRALAPIVPIGVLVADTIVVAPTGTLLGKPKSDLEARDMLSGLQGTTHSVLTRFALGSGTSSVVSFAQTVATSVTFRRLCPEEIDAYASSGEGRDKAGGYAVQGRAAAFVERIEGSYTNIVGLPLCEVVAALWRCGWIA